jgi:hypothetical protein
MKKNVSFIVHSPSMLSLVIFLVYDVTFVHFVFRFEKNGKMQIADLISVF